MRREHTLAATTAAISWTIYEADDFNVPRIDLVFTTAPSSVGLVTVTKKAAAGSAYDAIVSTVDPVGQTALSIDTLHGFVSGDKLLLEYLNPDAVSITGTASVELPLHGDLSTSGLTADNGTIRSLSSNYVECVKLEIGSIDPGASGATFVPATDDHIAGIRIDSPTEYLYASVCISDAWDTSTNPVLEGRVTSYMDNTGGTVDDIIKFQFDVSASSYRDPSIRRQTIYGEATVGQLPIYTQFMFSKELPVDIPGSEIRSGDTVSIRLNLAADSDIDDVLINQAGFYFRKTHVGKELGDV
jgi:hypothetical protein